MSQIVGYGDPVKTGRISVPYKIVPYKYGDGTVLYNIWGPPILDSDELFQTPEEAVRYIEELLS